MVRSSAFKALGLLLLALFSLQFVLRAPRDSQATPVVAQVYEFSLRRPSVHPVNVERRLSPAWTTSRGVVCCGPFIGSVQPARATSRPAQAADPSWNPPPATRVTRTSPVRAVEGVWQREISVGPAFSSSLHDALMVHAADTHAVPCSTLAHVPARQSGQESPTSGGWIGRVWDRAVANGGRWDRASGPVARWVRFFADHGQQLGGREFGGRGGVRPASSWVVLVQFGERLGRWSWCLVQDAAVDRFASGTSPPQG